MTNQYNNNYKLEQHEINRYNPQFREVSYSINRYSHNSSDHQQIKKNSFYQPSTNKHQQKQIPELQQQVINGKQREWLYNQKYNHEEFLLKKHYYKCGSPREVILDQDEDNQGFMSDRQYYQPPVQDYHYSEQLNTAGCTTKNRKNKVFALILTMVVPGLGHGYLDKWENSVYIFALIMACLLLSMFLYFPLLIVSLIIYVYAIIDVYRLTDSYNACLM